MYYASIKKNVQVPVKSGESTPTPPVTGQLLRTELHEVQTTYLVWYEVIEIPLTKLTVSSKNI